MLIMSPGRVSPAAGRVAAATSAARPTTSAGATGRATPSTADATIPTNSAITAAAPAHWIWVSLLSRLAAQSYIAFQESGQDKLQPRAGRRLSRGLQWLGSNLIAITITRAADVIEDHTAICTMTSGRTTPSRRHRAPRRASACPPRARRRRASPHHQHRSPCAQQVEMQTSAMRSWRARGRIAATMGWILLATRVCSGAYRSLVVVACGEG